MAQKRITDMIDAAALDGHELVEVSQKSSTVTITATTISALAADNSFNDSAAGFIAAGFAVGDRVNVAGFTGNLANNLFVGIVTVLTTAKMTIGGTDGDVIVDDAAGESVTISKWVSVKASVADFGGGGGGGAVAVEDEGAATVAAATVINFVGAGVSVADAGGGQADVTIPGATAAGWSLLYHWNHAVDGNIVSPVVDDITTNEILIIFDDCICSSAPPTPLASSLAIQVSIDNGATFINSGAPYSHPNVNNIEANDDYLRSSTATSTSARSSIIHIMNAQYADAPKVAMTNGDPAFMPTITAVINAIRLQTRAVTPPTFIAGKITVLGR